MRDLAMDREGGAAEASGEVVTRRRTYVRWSQEVEDALLARLSSAAKGSATGL
jgi:hypothetical protein